MLFRPLERIFTPAPPLMSSHCIEHAADGAVGQDAATIAHGIDDIRDPDEPSVASQTSIVARGEETSQTPNPIG